MKDPAQAPALPLTQLQKVCICLSVPVPFQISPPLKKRTVLSQKEEVWCYNSPTVHGWTGWGRGRPICMCRGESGGTRMDQLLAV